MSRNVISLQNILLGTVTSTLRWRSEPILVPARNYTSWGGFPAEEEIKRPYVLEFLDLKDKYSETDLEAALIGKLEAFLPGLEQRLHVRRADRPQ
jgi:hypothetical protein